MLTTIIWPDLEQWRNEVVGQSPVHPSVLLQDSATRPGPQSLRTREPESRRAVW